MGTEHTPPFVDGDIGVNNRVAAAWLNDLNKTNYELLGGSPGTAAVTSPSNRLAIAINVLSELLDAKGKLLTSNGAAPEAIPAGVDGLVLRTRSFNSDGIEWGAFPPVCQGRLTLATGTPVTVADQTAKTTLFFTPYQGYNISLYEIAPAAWKIVPFTEISIAIPAVTGMNDVFIFDSAGTLTLDITAWTNTTTRAVALALQNGVLVKNGAPERRYLGSFYSSTQVTDSVLKRNLFNYYNRVRRVMKVSDPSGSWNYTTAVFRQAHGDAANQIEYVMGVEEAPLMVRLCALARNSSGGVEATPGIGIDSTSVNSAYLFGLAAGAAGVTTQATAEYIGFPGIGRHVATWLEFSVATGTTTWFGGSGRGLVGEVWG